MPETLVLDLDEELLRTFQWAARQHGGPERLIARLLAGSCRPLDTALGKRRAERGAGVVVHVRLEGDDLESLDAARAQVGWSRGTWVQACVKARLRGAPQFGSPGLMAAVECRQELRRIGVALREIWRLMQSAGPASRQLERIEALHSETRFALESLREAMDGNLAYWRPRP